MNHESQVILQIKIILKKQPVSFLQENTRLVCHVLIRVMTLTFPLTTRFILEMAMALELHVKSAANSSYSKHHLSQFLTELEP